MGNSFSDTYKKDPIVRRLWSTLGAVPVLPVLPELQVYDFLQRRTDGFHHVGNVADLCCPGEKQKALAKMVKRMSNVTTSKEDVALKSCVENKGDLSSKLQVLNSVSWSALWSKSRTLEFEIPNWHQTCWTKTSERAELFEGFNLNARALPTTSRKSGTVTLYLVTDVIKVPSLKVTGWDKDGHAVEAAVLVDGTTPAVTGNIKIEKAKGGYFQLRSSNPRRPFPVAFRGIKCVFKHGLLQNWEPTTYQADSAAPAPVVAPQEEIFQGECLPVEEDIVQGDLQEDLPDDDEDMRDFVEGDKWFATIIYEGLPSSEEEEEEEAEEEADEEADEEMHLKPQTS